MKGRITSYSPKHGYGFINDNIYFHVKNWTLRMPPVVGMTVNYEIEETAKGERAINVRNKE